jgi:hypothetical protein
MGGVGGILREPKSMRIEAPWFIFYKADAFDKSAKAAQSAKL